jgi:16S rRNA (uracil1498-N3)-methyltransferase
MDATRLGAPIRHSGSLMPDRRIALGAEHVAALRFRGIKAKEAFTIVDGEGRFFRAALTVLGPKTGEALVYESMPTSTESPAHITLYCAVLGRQRMLGVIQKATELGVMRVVPVLSERSVGAEGLAHEKAHAWPAQALRACRQCRRASVPEIREAIPLEAVFADEDFRKADLRVHLDDRAAATSIDRTEGDAPPARIAFAVGPEGGFSDAERSAFDAHEMTALRLGGRVLRAETAVLVGLTLLQSAYGDMRPDGATQRLPLDRG